MENLEQTINHERNLETDRQDFLEAVSSTEIKEIQTNFDESAVKKLSNNLEQTKIFLLGEMHGVKENPDVIYTLFKKFGFSQLALEWAPKIHDVAQKFLQSGEIDFDIIKESPDGRITAGHFALLKKLNFEGLLKKLICFDSAVGTAVWNEIDAAMSKSILEGMSENSTLVVAGDLHTEVEQLDFDDEPGEQHPMGENIKNSIPNVSSGVIRYLTGQFHNLGTKEFEKTVVDQNEPRFFQNDDGLYVFQVPEAHLSTVPNPSERE